MKRGAEDERTLRKKKEKKGGGRVKHLQRLEREKDE